MLAWACAILPTEFHYRVMEECKEWNKNIGLPESVFKLPMHVSLKKSFETDNFEVVRKRMITYFSSVSPFEIVTHRVVIHNGMLWIDLELTDRLMQIHRDLDFILKKEFKIKQHIFDSDYKPHVSLFTNRDNLKIKKMYDLVKDKYSGERIKIEKIVVGASGYKDIFLDLKKEM